MMSIKIYQAIKTLSIIRNSSKKLTRLFDYKRTLTMIQVLEYFSIEPVAIQMLWSVIFYYILFPKLNILLTSSNIIKKTIYYIHKISYKLIRECFTNYLKSFDSRFYYLPAISKNLHTSLLTHILLPILILVSL